MFHKYLDMVIAEFLRFRSSHHEMSNGDLCGGGGTRISGFKTEYCGMLFTSNLLNKHVVT